MRGISSRNMNSAKMATVTVVIFIVALAPVLCGLAVTREDSHTGDCSGGEKDTKVVNVSQPNTKVTLKCRPSEKVKPEFNTEAFKVCTEEKCAGEQELSKYIEGATGEKTNGTTATVTIENLPPKEKTFYIQCGNDDSESCYIQVNVAKAPSEPGGVTTGGPLSCATGGGAITVKIPEKGSTAQFTCGDLTLYPVASDKVFAEDCKNEESLKVIVRSTKDHVYTLTADKKPPKKKWCYLCAESKVTPGEPGQASDYCVVRVESSSRTQSSSAIALGAMLPCVLTMLRIT